MAAFVEAWPPLAALVAPGARGLDPHRAARRRRDPVGQARPDHRPRAQGDVAGKVIVDFKTGITSVAHVADLRFYALIDTLRIGVPPRLLATSYLESGRLMTEDVTEHHLWSTIDRVVDAAGRLVTLTAEERDPEKRTGPPCRWCELRHACTEGRAYLSTLDDELVDPFESVTDPPLGSSSPGSSIGGGGGVTDRPTRTLDACRPRRTSSRRDPAERVGELVHLPTAQRTGRRTSASPTSTSGAAPSTCASSPASSTTRSTAAGSGPSGRASRRSRPTGGALLVANHAGAIPSDAPVIMHGIETELGRPVYGLADHLFRKVPVVGTLWSRLGGLPAHPDNAYRLLREQKQLVLVFPEGIEGPGASSTASATSCGASVAAASSRSPCAPACRSIPIAVVGRRGVDAHRVRACPSLAKAWAPVRADHRQHAGARPARASSPTSPPSSSSGCSTRSTSTSSPTRSATRAVADHGRVRGDPRPDPAGALRHAARPSVGLVR